MNQLFSEQNLLILQIFFLILSVIFILMQNRGAGLSSTFGGSDEVYLTRRGIEKWIVNLTTLCIVLFLIFRIIALYV
jgi:protein translocase SecG subunit